MLLLLSLCVLSCGPEPSCDALLKDAAASPACREAERQLQERLRNEKQAPSTGSEGKMPVYRW